MIQGLVTDEKTDTAASSGEVSIAWRLWQLVFRGMARLAFVAVLIAISLSHLHPGKVFRCVTKTQNIGLDIYIDQVSWLFYVETYIKPDWQLLTEIRSIDEMSSMQTLLLGESVYLQSERTLDSVLRPPWGYLSDEEVIIGGFGAMLGADSQMGWYFLSLKYRWVICLTLIAFWFADGRRIVRWLRRRKSA